MRETNPKRFGSPFQVAEIDRTVKRSAWFFFAAAIPTGLVAPCLIPSSRGGTMPPSARAWPVLAHGRMSPDLRIVAALVLAIVAGIISATLASRMPRRDVAG